MWVSYLEKQSCFLESLKKNLAWQGYSCSFHEVIFLLF